MATRLKKVFGRFDQITHLWANQIQDEAKCRNGFFKGKQIYSYGYHFFAGNIIEPLKIVLITTRTYSTTTAGHMRDVRNSVSHYPHQFHVPFIGNEHADGTISADHHAGNIEHYATEIKNALSTGRNSKKNALNMLNRATDLKKEALDYIRVFKLSKSYRNLVIQAYVTKGMKALIKKQAAYIEIDRTRIDERTAKMRQTRNENWQMLFMSEEAIKSIILPAWIADEEPVYMEKKRSKTVTYGRLKRLNETYLRLKDGMVETSRGAEVPVEAARTLFNMIKAGRDIKGYNLNGYTVIGMNGALTIGCHKIERAEINRFAASQGWGQIELH